MTKRWKFTPEFKANVALEILKGDKTAQEIASKLFGITRFRCRFLCGLGTEHVLDILTDINARISQLVWRRKNAGISYGSREFGVVLA